MVRLKNNYQIVIEYGVFPDMFCVGVTLLHSYLPCKNFLNVKNDAFGVRNTVDLQEVKKYVNKMIKDFESSLIN